MKNSLRISLACMLTLLASSPAWVAEAASEPIASTVLSPGAIDWRLDVAHEGGVVTYSGPDGIVHQLRFGAGENPSLVLGDLAVTLADGSYSYQLQAAPRVDAATREAMRRARETGNSEAVERDLRRAGKLPAEPLVLSGAFSIAGGAIVANDLVETTDIKVESAGSKVGEQLPTTKDQVIPDDLIVQGSICVGFDCVNNESFGFDTIRLKENNTRIKFEDTSVGSFPTNDWQLTANDSASGGSSKFSIEDITGARVPFTVTAGASTNSIFVDSTGRVGFRTSTPVLDLHVNTSNTPALRLEQNNSGGFTAQTWDIAGNEANFFVRDVTSGSRLPFRIRPGAPTSSVDISASGDVGVGTASPSAALHVSGSDGDTQLRVSETSGTTAARTILDLRNNGDIQFILRNTNSGENWQFLAFNNGFQISEVSTTNIFSFLEGGNMQIPGMYTSTSDRNAKENIEAVDPQQVLDKVLQLPIATWSFKNQDASMRHMGPMAQDFHALFGLGNDDKTIGVTDPGGVALAAIQGLYQTVQGLDQQVKERDASLEGLRQENSELKARLDRLEALLGK